MAASQSGRSRRSVSALPTSGGCAERLFVSSHTVKAEVKSIYRKLGVSSRHDAVQKATAIGLLGT